MSIGPTPVQHNSVNSSGLVTSQAVTLGAGIATGNMVVLAIACGDNATTFTPPDSSWKQVTINQPAGALATIEDSLWYLIVDSGHNGQTSWTWTLSNAHSVYIRLSEWHTTTSWPANPVDVFANGDTVGTPVQSTTVSSGTTATTAQAEELWIAALAYKGSAQTETGITSGWTKDLEATLANNNTATMLYKVASAVGTATCQYTIGTAEYWAACVVAFKDTPAGTTPALATSPVSLAFSASSLGANPASQTDTLSETSGNATAWTSSISYGPGASGWLGVSPSSGSLLASGTATITVNCTTGVLAPGTYTATITFTATTGGSVATITVSFAVGANGTTLLIGGNPVTMLAGSLLAKSTVGRRGELSAVIYDPSIKTNLFPNPSFEYSTHGQGWQIDGPDFSIAATGGFSRPYCVSQSSTTGFLNLVTASGSPLAVLPSTVYTASFYANITANNVNGLVVQVNKVSQFGTTIATMTITSTTTGYQRFSLTFTTDASTTAVWFRLFNNNGAVTALYDAFQLEQGPVATPYFDGSFAGASWAGPADLYGSDLYGSGLYGGNPDNSPSITTNYRRYQQYQYLSLFQAGSIAPVFTGYLTNPATQKPGFQPLLETTFTATDQHYLADKRIVAALYRNQTCGYIVNDMLTNILSQEGVTVGQIATGPVVPIANFGYVSVASALDALVAAASASGVSYYWMIDQNKQLWFVPYTAVTGPAVDGTQIDDGRLSGVIPTITPANPLYRNIQYATGGVAQTGSNDETKQGDGQTRSFPFNYQVAATPTLFTLNGNAVTLGIKGQTGYQYYYAIGDPIIAQDSSQTLLVSTDRLRMVYVGQIPTTFNAQNAAQITAQAQIDGTSGKNESVLNDPSIASSADGLAKCNQQLTQYSVQGELFQFATQQSGFAQGQLISVTYAPFGFASTQMLIEEIDLSDQQDGYNLWYTINAIVGPYDVSWVSFFSKLLQPATVANSINLGVTINKPLAPSLTLAPSTTLAPG